MKNSFISLSEARLMRYKAVNSGINLLFLNERHPAVRQLDMILSSKQFNQAGYL